MKRALEHCRQGVGCGGEVSGTDEWTESCLLVSALHFSDGRDIEVSAKGNGVAAGLRAAILTFFPPAHSYPKFP